MSSSSTIPPVVNIIYKPAVQYQPLDSDDAEHAVHAVSESERSAFGRMRYIKINHPGYNKSSMAPLLTFPPLDHGGVDYDLAIHACCLLVDNFWPLHGRSDEEIPYLSYSENPREQSPQHVINPSAVIINRDCYLHVPRHDGPDPYPITPKFYDWRFPHDLRDPSAAPGSVNQRPTTTLPAAWQAVDIPDDPNPVAYLDRRASTLARDRRCRVTNWSTGLEAAHICPKEIGDWFNTNGMDNYTNDSSVKPQYDDINNQILLRADVHIMLDRKEIVIIPKKVNNCYVFVIKVIKAPSASLFDAYHTFHNRICQEFVGVSVQYLFARFAWNIFNNDTLCIFSTPKLYLWVRILQGGSRSTLKYGIVQRLASSFKARSQSSSGESNKRSRVSGPADGDVYVPESEGTPDNSWTSSDEEDAYRERLASLDQDQEVRGRKRSRDLVVVPARSTGRFSNASTEVDSAQQVGVLDRLLSKAGTGKFRKLEKGLSVAGGNFTGAETTRHDSS